MVSNLVVQAIVRAAFDPERTAMELAELGLSEADVADADGFLSAKIEERLWERVAEIWSDTQVALRAARLLGKGTFRGLEYVVRASSTLGQGLERLARFNSLLYGRAVFSFEQGPAGVWLGYRSPHRGGSAAARFGELFALAATVALARCTTGRALNVVAVTCVAHEDVVGMQQFFGAPPVVGSEAGLRFSPEDAERHLLEADPVLCDIIERVLMPLQRSEAEELPSQIERVLRKLLPQGEPSLEEVCRRLGISRRTLQKQLRSSGTTFQQILTQLRMRLAHEYLRGDELSVPGIALLLGYTEVSSFYRAFRRNTGMTPQQARAVFEGAGGD